MEVSVAMKDVIVYILVACRQVSMERFKNRVVRNQFIPRSLMGKRELMYFSPSPFTYCVFFRLRLHPCNPFLFHSIYLIFLLFAISDQETANFLLGTMPLEWQAKNNVTTGKMVAALTLVRQSESLMTLSFEERVRRALLILEPPPPVPKTS